LKRGKTGRPALKQNEMRSNRVVTFVTNQQLDLLLHLAEEEGRTLSSFVRRIITQQLKEGSETNQR
jgi:hypothetical protein